MDWMVRTLKIPIQIRFFFWGGAAHFLPPFFLSVFFFCFWVEEWCSFFPPFFGGEAKSLFRESCFIVLVSWAFFFPCQVIIFSAWSGGAHFFHLFFLPFFWVEGWCSFFSTFFFFKQNPFFV